MRLSLILVWMVVFSTTAAAQNSSLADSLERLERESWRAWQGHDGKFFDRFLSADHVEVGSMGIASKAQVVQFVGSGACTVSSYSLDRFKATPLAPNVVLLSYHAAQNTLCGGAKVPSPVWVSSLYVNHDGSWLCAVYQQTTDLTPRKN